MSRPLLDVVGVGNAIVDVIANADDRFVAEQGMVKGTMALIDEARAATLYALMGPAVESSGGSTGNTIAGLASFGAKTGFIGKVRDDLLGSVFRHDITSIGAAFPTPAAPDGPGTAFCLIVVTPDAQRTMNTYLGACVNLGPEDVDEDLIRSAQVTHLEGYLLDSARGKDTFIKASQIAHAAGRKVSLSLSDAFCVRRHLEEFKSLVDHHIDLIFANEREAFELFGTERLDVVVEGLRSSTEVAAVTRSEKGSVIVSGSSVIDIAAEPVPRVVDSTGAGDLYAAGFLWGLCSGAGLPDCGRLGSIAAAEVIGHMGARPETPLRTLAAV
ncbi:MAG: adenosine kinase [Candidatus Eremiobacteraeota bacterium]|nr:adenosine kinase [Candidatus Eremiobacteraeota bacterium]